jgi:hypothetical protein
VSCDR